MAPAEAQFCLCRLHLTSFRLRDNLVQSRLWGYHEEYVDFGLFRPWVRWLMYMETVFNQHRTRRVLFGWAVLFVLSQLESPTLHNDESGTRMVMPRTTRAWRQSSLDLHEIE